MIDTVRYLLTVGGQTGVSVDLTINFFAVKSFSSLWINFMN